METSIVAGAASCPPKTKPILFSGSMVRAILSGRKTQTRRLMKPQPVRVMEHERPLPNSDWTIRHGRGWKWQISKDVHSYTSDECPNEFGHSLGRHCPYGITGGLLWVRESIVYKPEHDNFYFAADGQGCGNRVYVGLKKRACPSIHMPRWASRLTLRITGVRVERLQDISEEDAKAEGVDHFKTVYPSCSLEQPIIGTGRTAGDMPYGASFAVLWDTINAERGAWQSNRWVWAIAFERVNS